MSGRHDFSNWMLAREKEILSGPAPIRTIHIPAPQVMRACLQKVTMADRADPFAARRANMHITGGLCTVHDYAVEFAPERRQYRSSDGSIIIYTVPVPRSQKRP